MWDEYSATLWAYAGTLMDNFLFANWVPYLTFHLPDGYHLSPDKLGDKVSKFRVGMDGIGNRKFGI